MSSRGLMNDSRAPIYEGEKFNAFMTSNADVFIVMIGTNDDRKNPLKPESKLGKDRLVLWNNT